MAPWESDEIDFEGEYDKADPIDDDNLDESINELNTKLEQWIAFNEEKQGLYIMRASKTILSILHRGFDKIKQGGRVMVLDEKSAEKLYK